MKRFIALVLIAGVAQIAALRRRLRRPATS
jgi:hypothetical protein